MNFLIFHQVPSFVNLGSPAAPSMGWSVIIALMQQIWLPEDALTDSQAADWLFMLGDDLNMAAGLMMVMENHPSICLGSLQSSLLLEDYEAKGAQALKEAEQLPPVNWPSAMSATLSGGILFAPDVVEEPELPDHEEQAALQSKAHTPSPEPLMEVSKKRPRTESPATPKPPAKPKAPKKAPKAAAEISTQSQSSPKPSPPPKVASTLKSRLGMASGIRRS